MSWSYSGNPADSNLDELRFTIGDTDANNPELSDEELNFIIAKFDNGGDFSPLQPALESLRRILARYKSLIDEKVGDVDVKWSQRVKNLKDLIGEFELEFAKYNLGSAYAGGISITDKANNEDSTDRVTPAFTKDFGANKRLGSTSTTVRQGNFLS